MLVAARAHDPSTLCVSATFSCDGHIDIPIGEKSNIATHARIKVGVTYDHESCQGFVSLKNEITGNSEVVWTHDKGTTTDIATVEVKLEEGDVFVVSETGTCTSFVGYVYLA